MVWRARVMQRGGGGVPCQMTSARVLWGTGLVVTVLDSETIWDGMEWPVMPQRGEGSVSSRCEGLNRLMV